MSIYLHGNLRLDQYAESQVHSKVNMKYACKNSVIDFKPQD